LVAAFRLILLDSVPDLFHSSTMDWDRAIERNREPLLRIVAALFAMIGLSEAGRVERLSRPIYRAVLLVLRPAEAAVRRLIIVAARGMVVKPSPKRAAKAGLTISSKGQGRVSFRLFDPRKRFDQVHRRPHRGPRPQPRIRCIGVDFDPRVPSFLRFEPIVPQPVAPAPAPAAQASQKDDTVNALPLCRRLAAIKLALDDLPRQAKRLARWRARPVAERRPRLSSPMRPGRPPGRRKRQTHEVDEILRECHWLAHNVPVPNTS
jgi:hypothetical protein